MFFRKKKDERYERIKKLCDLVSMLDRIRAFRRTYVEDVEDLFKEIPYRDIRSEWKKIRHAVEKIVAMPYRSREITRLIKITYYLRTFMMFALTLAIFPMYARLLYARSTSPLPKWIAFITDLRVIIIFMATFPIVGGLWAFFDHKTRKAIIKYEREHREKLKLGRMKIKSLIEKVIAKIVSEAKRMRVDLDEFKVELYYMDYKGVVVLEEEYGRIFKRKWPIYVVKFNEKV